MTDKQELLAPEPAAVSAPSVGNAAGIMAMIDRAATDPNYDMAKMEKMMDMFNAERDRTAREAYMRDMADCQRQLPAVAKDAENDQTNSQYATVDSVNRAIVPVITSHGFSLTFGEDTSPKEGHMRVVCEIGHRDGHSTVGHHLDVPMDATGIKGSQNKTWTHALGSTATYGRRYLTMMMFNVTLAGEDDDGDVAGGAPATRMIDNVTFDKINALCAEKGRTAAQVLTLIKTKYGEAPKSLEWLALEHAKFALGRLEAL